jgi:hypothetical protein
MCLHSALQAVSSSKLYMQMCSECSVCSVKTQKSQNSIWPLPSSISSHRKESFGEASEGSKSPFWLFFAKNAHSPFNLPLSQLEEMNL